MIAALWGDDPRTATGCSTTGSSEACMLAGLALERRWRARGAADRAGRPNLVMGTNVQVCWEKFCRYWDVEARMVPVGDGATHLTPERAAAACDENTIGVVAILGSTFDGTYEPVADIAAALDRLQAERGLDVPMHVDAASGGFVAPFIDPDLVWDFRLKRVQSINASGHKYGLVYPGVGWALWREPEALPEELVFHVDYLGGDMPTFSLNFSRPGAQVAAQYYTFLRLGHAGYSAIHQACRDTAQWLAARVAEIGPFELVSDGSQLPVFAFRLRGGVKGYSVYDVSEAVRSSGWIVPAYRMPPGLEETHVLRVVVRNGFGRDLARALVDDLQRTVERLQRVGGRVDADGRAGFHH
jgi:glutamate decarboxylase